MKIYLQEPTIGSRRGIFRCEIKADDGYGDYGLGYNYGWGFTPAGAEKAASGFGPVIAQEAVDIPEDERLAAAANAFYFDMLPNLRPVRTISIFRGDN